jgi:hypothetical protein
MGPMELRRRGHLEHNAEILCAAFGRNPSRRPRCRAAQLALCSSARRRARPGAAVAALRSGQRSVAILLTASWRILNRGWSARRLAERCAPDPIMRAHSSGSRAVDPEANVPKHCRNARTREILDFVLVPTPSDDPLMRRRQQLMS